MTEDTDHSDARAAIRATRGSPPPDTPVLVESPEAVSPEAEPEVPEASSAPSAVATDSLPPPVVSVDPAMFIPLDFDIAAPFAAPRSRAERAQSMLQTMDFFHAGGRRGMMHLADMDRRRILAQTTDRRDEKRQEFDRLELEREFDAMIQNMVAPCRSAEQAYNTSDAELAQYMASPAAGGTSRRDTALQLQQLVEQVLVQVHGYDGHMYTLRARWVAELQKERLMAQQGSTESAAATPTTTTNANTSDVTMTGN